MASRKHDRTHFYKYSTAETAKKVIATRKFRWSSPAKFNDPFDHQSGFVLTSTPEEFAQFLTVSIERIVFSENEPHIQPDSLFSAMNIQLRAIRHRLPRDEVLRDIHEGSMECAANLHTSIQDLNVAIHDQLLHSRVFCVSEIFDNVVMWSHYGGAHTGVVFKLRCIDELDNALLTARKVSYVTNFVAFPSAEEYARHLTGEARIDFADLAWNIAYTKHKDWAYEKEWRVHVPLLSEPAGDGYSYYSEQPQVFEAVYLGCRIGEEDCVEIQNLISENLPNTQIFRGGKSETEFGLSFKEI